MGSRSSARRRKEKREKIRQVAVADKKGRKTPFNPLTGLAVALIVSISANVALLAKQEQLGAGRIEAFRRGLELGLEPLATVSAAVSHYRQVGRVERLHNLEELVLWTDSVFGSSFQELGNREINRELGWSDGAGGSPFSSLLESAAAALVVFRGRAEYFEALPDFDAGFADRWVEELRLFEVAVRAMPARLKADRRSAAQELREAVQRLENLCDAYADSGVFPEDLPSPAVDAAQAEAFARAELDIGGEFVLAGQPREVRRLRENSHYWELVFKQRGGAQAEILVAVDARQARLVAFRDGRIMPPDPQKAIDSVEKAAAAALARLAEYPGEKRIVSNDGELVSVVPVVDGVPVFVDRVVMSFDRASGELVLFVSPGWGTKVRETVPKISATAAQQALQGRAEFKGKAAESRGLAVVRSAFTFEPTLVYVFRVDGVAAYVNALDGRLEGTGGAD